MSYLTGSQKCGLLKSGSGCCVKKNCGQRREMALKRAHVCGIYNKIVMKVIQPVKSVTCCYNLCLINPACRAFAYFKDKKQGTKICKLMKQAQLCHQTTPTPNLQLISYYEKLRIISYSSYQYSHASKVLPATARWRRDCWTSKCAISAIIGFLYVT
ncbi:Uncharacterised protein g11443 [Pycnogonum litorale]